MRRQLTATGLTLAMLATLPASPGAASLPEPLPPLREQHRIRQEWLKLRLERFLVVYDRALSDRLDRVERVDARYEGGVAVRWRREEGQMVATSNFSGG